ncbi:acyl-CoA dehydrogenase family protein [Sphingomonas colocasiae]|uniref:Acyl-CoA dehydrogenase family protein n=1 Tax=Sphingomonas colocasiae TaxID=1848973 RepID=A0ABS7PSL9_9SPHN|nr:acyl-CoA dehydrogenase family protein [Sphingomonas colocasiae]MBY8824333.1 acyl-CoA dehydrogenase family protein [Sphingomonas colocasiae]
MISFELTEEQEIIRSTMREISRDALSPEARRHDLDGAIGTAVLDTIWQAGIVQAQADRESRSPVSNVLVLEELAAGDASVALAVGAASGFVQAVTDQGSEAQRAVFLASLEGDRFAAGTIAAMEPDFVGDVTRPATRVLRSEDGFTLSGRKTMVPLAAQSTHFLVIADLDGASDAFIVDASATGVTIEARQALGLRGLGLGEVNFDGVVLPTDARLGEGNGADVQRIIDGARVGLAAAMLGLSRAVMEHIIPYTKERVVHGSPLAQKQKIAFDIADMRMETDAIRWMTWKAAWALETGLDATRLAQLAYTYAGERVMQIADNGLQSMGGHGFVEEHPMEMWYRNARSLSMLESVAGV